ncbi:MAG TPA: glycosyltransferase [Dongiaceae bacterium]|nr:glycosyltransferase [Dongiaceae bacterium]
MTDRAPPLNVCVIGLRGVPGILGGVESHCEQLLPRLQALSPDYRISVVGRHPYLPAARFDYKGVTVVPLPALRSKYFEAISNTALAVLYARFSGRARLLHIHNIGPALLGPVARLLGMKLIVTYHSRNYEHAKWNRVARAILRLGERCAVAAAHKVIVISRSMTDDLKRRYPRAAAKFVFVPNGATEFPMPAGGEEERALLDRFGLQRGRYILAVGRLVPEKSFHTLIAAFKASNAGLKLVIAGKADHEDAYSRSLLAEADERICFTGFQGHRELGILYRNASLFVLPSTHEGLPIAALEAASLGVPVLLSDIQPNLDIDLPAACYFPVGDVEMLRHKILQPHEAYRIDHEGIARRFDWSLVARQTKDVYADVCATN